MLRPRARWPEVLLYRVFPLLEQGMRPTQVVLRNASFTHTRAAAFFQERRGGDLRWAGVRWWSFHRPFWTNVMLWQSRGGPPPAGPERVDQLDLDHVAVRECAKTLAKPL